MRERNLCHESGCPDLCCNNTFSRFTPEELEENFPKAKLYPWNMEIECVDEGIAILGPVGKDGRHLVFIKGRCPQNIKGCSADKKPFWCRTHTFAGERCNEFRKNIGLSEISFADKEIIPI
jgi:hypothetical protein